MARRHTCSSCGTSITAGEAVIRSIDFEQVAWHPECYLTRDAESALCDSVSA